MGADDYLTKPFSLNELMARVNSLIRRFTTLNPTSTIDINNLTLKNMVIDKENRIVSINAVPVDLTSKEFDLLYFWLQIMDVYSRKSRFTPMYGQRNMLSMITTLCPLSASCGKRLSQTQNILFIF